MNLELEFALSVAILYLIFVVFFKALRDIIQFRFEWSIFDNIKWKWLRDYLTDNNPNAPRAFDGWHQSDGAVVLFPLAVITYWGNRFIYHAAWWKVIIAILLIAFVFYMLFNFLYHRALMKKEFRGKVDEPKR
jgi:uncharacterized membrane protein